MEKEQTDIYARVTRHIVEAIEAGAGRFRLPWHVTGTPRFRPRNAMSQSAYRGVNVLALWATAEARGYESGTWATYGQWCELGAQVRKGEKSTPVALWKVTERKRKGEDEEAVLQGGFYACGYAVFNAAQVDGYRPPEPLVLPEAERVAKAEAFFADIAADVRTGGQVACYDRAADCVHIPPFAAFREAAGYYSVLGHELTHWTGAAHRLNRDLAHRFGSEAYAMEELVAELGAAFLCSALGLSNDPRPDHAAYLASWLRVLKQDRRAVFTAASQAQKAVDWLSDTNAA
ncbi:MAG: zincin-like metallopeptidase domain-containing protein [Gemmataceae bacterium]